MKQPSSFTHYKKKKEKKLRIPIVMMSNLSRIVSAVRPRRIFKRFAVMKQVMTCPLKAAPLSVHTSTRTISLAIFEAQSFVNRSITSNYFVPLQQTEGDLPIVTLQLDWHCIQQRSFCLGETLNCFLKWDQGRIFSFGYSCNVAPGVSHAGVVHKSH